MLILFTPRAPRERYFEGLVEAAGMDSRPDKAAMAEFFREHDSVWLT